MYLGSWTISHVEAILAEQISGNVTLNLDSCTRPAMISLGDGHFVVLTLKQFKLVQVRLPVIR